MKNKLGDFGDESVANANDNANLGNSGNSGNSAMRVNYDAD